MPPRLLSLQLFDPMQKVLNQFIAMIEFFLQVLELTVIRVGGSYRCGPRDEYRRKGSDSAYGYAPMRSSPLH